MRIVNHDIVNNVLVNVIIVLVGISVPWYVSHSNINHVSVCIDILIIVM